MPLDYLLVFYYILVPLIVTESWINKNKILNKGSNLYEKTGRLYH